MSEWGSAFLKTDENPNEGPCLQRKGLSLLLFYPSKLHKIKQKDSQSMFVN